LALITLYREDGCQLEKELRKAERLNHASLHCSGKLSIRKQGKANELCQIASCFSLYRGNNSNEQPFGLLSLHITRYHLIFSLSKYYALKMKR
jgi:hypothetical protein